jgi:hydroxymethylpyrimidine pyrophosphatase-like HAD family hydrolase
VAVANALPAVKDGVDWVTERARGAGVTELIEHLLEGTLPDKRAKPES